MVNGEKIRLTFNRNITGDSGKSHRALKWPNG